MGEIMYKVTLTKEDRITLVSMTPSSRKWVHALILLNTDRGAYREEPKRTNREIAAFLKVGETKIRIAAKPGSVEKYDYEYVRNGVCNIFMNNEPLAGKRFFVKVTERKTKQDWAVFLEDIANQYKEAEKITLVMDNLETHKPGALYESFSTVKAKSLWDRFEFILYP